MEPGQYGSPGQWLGAGQSSAARQEAAQKQEQTEHEAAMREWEHRMQQLKEYRPPPPSTPAPASPATEVNVSMWSRCQGSLACK